MQHNTRDTIVVVDFEATCFDKTQNINRNEMEIIEFGMALIDLECNIISTFESFVQPVIHPQLSKFCKELTGIEQFWVDSAYTFPKVYEKALAWLNESDAIGWVSWGDFDKNILKRNANQRGINIDHPILLDHTNVKEVFAKTMGYSKSKGIGASLSANGMEFEGNAHRALDDVKNIVRLLKLIGY